MKIVLFVIFAFAIFTGSQAGGEAEKPIKVSPVECSFCSVDVDPNQDCVCSSSARVMRKYACGPACDAIGFCCASTACPTCGSGVNPTVDSECTCEARSVRTLRKYACGPACDAIGFCCNADATTAAPTTSSGRRMKCVKQVQPDTGTTSDDMILKFVNDVFER